MTNIPKGYSFVEKRIPKQGDYAVIDGVFYFIGNDYPPDAPMQEVYSKDVVEEKKSKKKSESA